MINLTNYTSTQLIESVKYEPFPYFFKDNFIKKDLFKQLNHDFNQLKKSNKINWTIVEPPKTTRFDENKGSNYVIGGGGKNRGSIEPFLQLIEKYDSWKYFIEQIKSNECFEFLNEIFLKSKHHTTNINNTISRDGEWQVGCKISCFTNNYGYIIHPDNVNKVLSFLLYLDNDDWNETSNKYKNGTQIWKVCEQNIKYDNRQNSIDTQLRSGRYSKKIESLKNEEADKVEMVKAIDFVPNRMVGFVRTDFSYHSIYPMRLPLNTTRDCFQINIWKTNERY